MTDDTCIACKNKIIKNAMKCTECGGFQNWRRNMDVGNTSISMLVALISVLTIFISTADYAWTSPENVNINVIEVGSSQITIAITNSGEESAVISPNPTLSDGILKAFALNIVNDSKNQLVDLVIKPGEVQVMTALVQPIYKLNKISENQCQLILPVIKINGKKELKTTSFPCKVAKL